jgi:hypothetical protein
MRGLCRTSNVCLVNFSRLSDNLVSIAYRLIDGYHGRFRESGVKQIVVPARPHLRLPCSGDHIGRYLPAGPTRTGPAFFKHCATGRGKRIAANVAKLPELLRSRLAIKPR